MEFKTGLIYVDFLTIQLSSLSVLIFKYFRSNYHFPLRYIIYIGITALIRLIIVSHEEPMETLLYAGAILVLVIALYISNMRDLRKE